MVNVPSIAALGLDVVAHETITIERRTGALNADGAWVDAAPTFETAAASVQPARGRDLDRLPEGRRGLETIRVLTRAVLQSNYGLGAGQRADVVVFNGNRYEVEGAPNWSGVFVDVLAVRLGD